MAPTSSTRQTATCATTSVLRSRWPVRPPLPRLPSSLRAWMVSGFEACSAGARPNNTPVTTEIASANSIVVWSIRRPRSIGMSIGGTNAMITSMVQYAMATPSAPATAASAIDSVSSWRTRRPRLAPSDSRTATSRRRPTAFDSSRFATLAHAITSTITTSTDSTASTGASAVAAPNGAAQVSTRRRRRPSLLLRYSLSSCAMIDVASAWACARETPGLRRPIDCIQPLPRAFRRSPPITSRCIIIGSQAAVETPRNEPRKPSCATPIDGHRHVVDGDLLADHGGARRQSGAASRRGSRPPPGGRPA